MTNVTTTVRNTMPPITAPAISAIVMLPLDLDGSFKDDVTVGLDEAWVGPLPSEVVDAGESLFRQPSSLEFPTRVIFEPPPWWP